jgi:hypothetical protein
MKIREAANIFFIWLLLAFLIDRRSGTGLLKCRYEIGFTHAAVLCLVALGSTSCGSFACIHVNAVWKPPRCRYP